MVEERYGILLTMPSDPDLCFGLYNLEGKVVEFSSAEEAVQAAEKLSEEQRLVLDWIYNIVHLRDATEWGIPVVSWGGMPIESYHSVPRFERIPTARV